MIWMISANGKMYDHASSFATNGFIDWRQRAKYNVGDIVYIYCTRPFMRIIDISADGVQSVVIFNAQVLRTAQHSGHRRLEIRFDGPKQAGG